MTFMVTICRMNGEMFHALKFMRKSRGFSRYCRDMLFGYAWNKFEDVKAVEIVTLATFLENPY